MEKPLVSIIVPTYNRTDLLKITLESLVGQTYRPIEVIVVDDGSTGDANQQLCDSFDEVSYIKIPNSGGPAKPRNVGFEQSKGSLIAWVDDDDLWLPTKLEKQVEILQKHEDFGLVHGPCAVIDEHGKLSEEIIGKPADLEQKHGDVARTMMGNWTLMMPTPLLRREVAIAAGGFDEEIPPALEDVHYWVKCSFETHFYYLDEVLVHYRKHSSNISSNRRKYLQLPLYLNEIRRSQQQKNRINARESNKLLEQLCVMQLRMWKIDRWQVWKRLWKLDLLWWLRPRCFKLLIKLLFS